MLEGIIILVLLIEIPLFLLWLLNRPESYRQKNGVKVIVSHDPMGDGVRMSVDMNDKRTREFYFKEARKYAELWESSKNCKH